MTKAERFAGCIIAGAIGDAFGSSYEQSAPIQRKANTYYPFGQPAPKRFWTITDDTQLTLATCEAIINSNGKVLPEPAAQRYLHHYRERRLIGLGGSTLKALQELDAGGHWSQVGRRGEYAAGNGAAMRIAPLAFIDDAVDKQAIEAICRLTQHHDEAYAGALAVILAIRAILNGSWTGSENLLQGIIDELPDTRVRDRLLEIDSVQEHFTVGQLAASFGSTGYVVDSVPLAILAASRVPQLGFEQMLNELVQSGGDTDTNCSIASQVAGALLGLPGIPPALLQKLMRQPEYPWIAETVNRFGGLLS